MHTQTADLITSDLAAKARQANQKLIAALSRKFPYEWADDHLGVFSAKQYDGFPLFSSAGMQMAVSVQTGGCEHILTLFKALSSLFAVSEETNLPAIRVGVLVATFPVLFVVYEFLLNGVSWEQAEENIPGTWMHQFCEAFFEASKVYEELRDESDPIPW